MEQDEDWIGLLLEQGATVIFSKASSLLTPEKIIFYCPFDLRNVIVLSYVYSRMAKSSIITVLEKRKCRQSMK
jgi:hypothetical protein